MFLETGANLSGIGILCQSRFSMVLLVRNAIFRSVCLNALVMYKVSLPMLVNVTHLGLEFCVNCCRAVLLGSCFCGVIGNELLCRM